MPHDKVEELISRFARDIEALVRTQVRAEITRALEACFAEQASRARAPGEGTRPRRRAPAAVLEDKPVAPAAPPVEVAAAAPDSPGKRRGWTREAVVAELATWLLTGTVIEASFLTKHGKPGLVAAARKHFGRFDAALNAANVHLAHKHPEGPPTANRGQRNGVPGK
jgi:hypothetical protein